MSLLKHYHEALGTERAAAVSKYDKTKLKRVADAFTRFLIGNPKAAIMALTQLKDSGVQPTSDVSDPAEEFDAAEYNRMYTGMYNAILKAIKQELDRQTQ